MCLQLFNVFMCVHDVFLRCSQCVQCLFGVIGLIVKKQLSVSATHFCRYSLYCEYSAEKRNKFAMYREASLWGQLFYKVFENSIRSIELPVVHYFMTRVF